MTNPQNPWEPSGQPPQQPGGQPQYQGGAMPPPREQYVPVEQQRPQSVETSFKLWLVNIGLGVLAAILTFVVLDDLIEQAAGEVGVSVEAAQDAARPAVTLGVVIRLAVLAGITALVFQMRNAKNWARITLTVLAGLTLLLSLINIGDIFAIESAMGTVLGLIGILQLLTIVAAVVFMYFKDANAFFASKQNQY